MKKIQSRHRTENLMSNKKRNEVLALAFLLPSIILFAMFKYYPILSGVFVSFFDIDIVNLPGDFCGFKNYLRAFGDTRFYEAIWHNVKFFAYSIVMTFWQPIILAILVNEMRRKSKTVFRLLYFIPAVVPAIATTILWKYFFNPDYGLANYVVQLFGGQPQLWLNDENWVYFCMNFPGMVVFGGMAMVYYLAALQDVPNDLYEASMLEGANFVQRVRYVTLPGIKNIVITQFILSLTGIFGTMENILLWTGGGPAGETETILVYAYKQAINSMDYSYAITLSTIVFIVTLVITYAFQKRTQEE